MLKQRRFPITIFRGQWEDILAMNLVNVVPSPTKKMTLEHNEYGKEFLEN